MLPACLTLPAAGHISLEELGLDPDMVQDPFLGALKLHLRDRCVANPGAAGRWTVRLEDYRGAEEGVCSSRWYSW